MAIIQSYDAFLGFYAVATADGRLRVWESLTEGGNLKVNFTFKSNLADGFFSISWSNCLSPEKDNGILQIFLVALGSRLGNIYVFDVKKGEIYKQLKGHKDAVNSLVFGESNAKLYSCSSDRYIIEWCISTEQPLRSWIGDTQPLHSLFCNKHCFLSAGRTIKNWDVVKKKILKKYSGHENFIKQLLLSPNGEFFLTLAEEDRFVYVWPLEGPSQQDTVNSVAVLSAASSALWMDLCSSGSGEFCVTLIVTCENLQVWNIPYSLLHKDSTPKNSLSPNCTINIVANNGKCLPLLSAKFTRNSEIQVLIAYGSSLKPLFVLESCVSGSGEWREHVTITGTPEF
jgi:WD40 repeat protein